MGARHLRGLLRAAVILGVLLCLVFAIGGADARADSEGAATVTASALNLRSEPSTSSAIIACVPRGTVVLVTGESGDWYAVNYQGHSGYMSKQYLSYSVSANAGFGTGTVKADYVNVRSGPSTAYSVLGMVSTGRSFPITGVSGAFYQFSYNGATAYIASAYVTVSGSSGGSAAPTTPPASQAQGTGVITDDYVRLRTGPGTGYTILGTYNTGTKMTITGQSGDWYAVTYNGMKGYVYKQYLSQSGSSAQVTEMSATAAHTTAGVNLREGPSTAYPSKRVLAAGTSVTVNGKSGQWYRVDWSGVGGYIYQDYVSLSSGQSGGGSTVGDKLVTEAKKYLGVPYVYGGTSPSGFDCSGFVYYVYKQCGYSITRTATAQNSVGSAVSRSDLKPGDIIIFLNGAKTSIGHSGMYIGNNQFIHASSGGGRVMISGLSESYYNARFYSARRVAK